MQEYRRICSTKYNVQIISVPANPHSVWRREAFSTICNTQMQAWACTNNVTMVTSTIDLMVECLQYYHTNTHACFYIYRLCSYTGWNLQFSNGAATLKRIWCQVWVSLVVESDDRFPKLHLSASMILTQSLWCLKTRASLQARPCAERNTRMHTRTTLQQSMLLLYILLSS